MRSWPVVMMSLMKLRRRSALHSITVEDRGGVRTMLFDDVVQSTMRLDDSSHHGLEYADFIHLIPALRRPPATALVIGLGGATVPKQLLETYDAVRLDVVEIDAAVVELAAEHFGFTASERCDVHVADGAEFIRDSNRRWDWIIVDAYTIIDGELAPPPALVTEEFMAACDARLDPDGVLVFNSAAAPSNVTTARLCATIASSFPHSLVFESSSSDNSVIIASRSPLETRADQIARAVRSRIDPAVTARYSLIRRSRQLVPIIHDVFVARRRR